MISVNPQSLVKDIQSVKPGGYFIYDSTKLLHEELLRDDITFLGIPLMETCNREYSDPRQRQLFKNVMYVGALSALIEIEYGVLEQLIAEQFKGKEKLIAPNLKALNLGVDWVKQNLEHPLPFRLERRDLVGDRIMTDGNSACALGAVYGGATFVAWYPITPSTSVAEAFDEYAGEMREDEHGKNKYAIVQAEDELAAIGMVIGAGWNGARSFTATSGPGVSLMNEFLGLAYFSEIPAVLIDVQRTGPSTGMPTRTQQSDLLLAAYASHGDTKHPMLFPATPKECFDHTALSLDLAERLQTPIMIMTDLDLGMNDHMSEPFVWDDSRVYDRGKVLTAQQLDEMPKYGRYVDSDGDGITYRTIPGVHPSKGAYVARGTSRDEYAVYTEESPAYQRNMDRLTRKWQTIRKHVPAPEIVKGQGTTSAAMLFFGTSTDASFEARDMLAAQGIMLDACRLTSFPFHADVEAFMQQYDVVYVIEQNRDAQMCALLQLELQIDPARLRSVLNYDGMPITADRITEHIQQQHVHSTAAQ
jgi:2-oxoglutarate ferredoxin oxidoreductase subunit alpha